MNNPVKTPRSPLGRNPRSGSVILLVLVTLLLAAWGVSRFVEKAYTELQAEARAIHADRLRADAYSALEITLAVLNDFTAVDGSLRSPAQGWQDPLAYAGIDPPEGQTVRVLFEDEGAKLSLPTAGPPVLRRLFEQFGFDSLETDSLVDALLNWIRPNHSPSTLAVDAYAYERAVLPYQAPGRSLRSFSELAGVQVFRDLFFDEDGRPNEAWDAFVASVSLFDFDRSNINAANPTTLMARSGLTEFQVDALMGYLSGRDQIAAQGRLPYFSSMQEVTQRLGSDFQASGLTTDIQVLRILIEVAEGTSTFRLSAVLAPASLARRPGGAQGGGDRAQARAAMQAGSGTARGANSAVPPSKNLQYPFKLLDIRENDAIPAHVAQTLLNADPLL